MPRRWLAAFLCVFIGLSGGAAAPALAQTDADIVQEGDNDGDADQDGTVRTGDGGAGSQITGIVQTDPGSTTSVRKTNRSEDGEATSGDASVETTASVTSGPRSEGGSCPAPLTPGSLEGPIASCIVQDGDNEVETTQTSEAASGDAIAATQVSGIVNEGGDVVLDLLSEAEDAESETGVADAQNEIIAEAGPLTGGEVGAGSVGDAAGAASITGPVRAFIVQDGDNEVDVLQASTSTTGDAVAGGQVSGVVAGAAARVNVDSEQRSEDAEATSGNSDSYNNTEGSPPPGVAAATVHAGPVVGSDVKLTDPAAARISGVTLAGVVQDGDNEVGLDQTASAASGDALAGAAVVGVVAPAGSVDLRLRNTAEDPEATSGDAEGDNVSPAHAGDVYSEGAIVTDETIEDVEALPNGVVHDGDNAVEVTQDAAGASGDAVAGSQVLAGVTAGVITLGGSVAIDATNASEDDEATTGNADAANTNGPVIAGNLSALGDITVGSITDVGRGGVVHDGDNDLALTEAADAATGDAVAGGQVFGAVGAGDTSIVASNTSEDGEATTGDADATNTADVTQAGSVNSRGGIAIGASIEGTFTGDELILHDGDNELELDATADGASGDAVAGGQVVGAVTSAGGSAAIDVTNDAEDAEATSGDAVAGNLAETTLAGNVNGNIPITVGDAAIDADVPDVDELIVRDGDNELGLRQAAAAATGDAVAGGQIAGVIGAGDTDLVADNTSEDAEATSGDGTATNDSDTAFAGDLNSNSLVDVGAAAIEGTITQPDEALLHDGDNELTIDQAAGGTTGDAVAGGQVAGSVTAAGGAVAVDLANDAEDPEATSGDSTATTLSELAYAGNLNTNSNVTVGTASIDVDVTEADELLVHDGDNELTLDQASAGETGDAVGGGQIAGFVGAGDMSATARNTTEDAEATSGDSAATSSANVTFAGDLNSNSPVDIGTFSIEGTFTSPDEALFHEGDDELDLAQAAEAVTGDAVGGGQVMGAVTAAGGVASIDLTNDAEDPEATSGDSTAASDSDIAFAGNLNSNSPVDIGAASIDIDVTEADELLIHEGDNELGLGQDTRASTGDAVAGGQVAGVVGAGAVAVTGDNTSEDAEATSGDADAASSSDVAFAGNLNSNSPVDLGVGVLSIDGTFSSPDELLVHEGDNGLDFAQTSASETGDAVAGGQVVGAVTGGGSSSIDLTNVEEDAEATSGDSTATSDSDVVFAGNLNSNSPVTIETASIDIDVTAPNPDEVLVHEGDNELDATQAATGATGDAVAGGQVAGLVGAGDVALTAGNTSEDAEATTGDTTSAADTDVAFAGNLNSNSAVDIVGTTSIDGTFDSPDELLVHEGDNELTLDQAASAATGDAVAGGQVAGAVTTAGAVAAIDLTNTDEDGEATSGDGTATADTEVAFAGDLNSNTDVTVGTASIDIDVTDGDQVLVHEGDNELDVAQSAGSATGDAVAGGQVAGLVGGGEVSIAADNASEDAEAASGDSAASSAAGVALAGDVNVNDSQDLILGASIDGSLAADELTVHEGDNQLAVGQSADAATGDAVAGGQVMGAVTAAGSSLSIDTANTAEDAESTSGDATATNLIENAVVGSIVAGTLTTASIDATIVSGRGVVLDGDNEGDIRQSLDTASGDAVGGSQIVGAVLGAGAAVDIVQDNASEDDASTTGDATGTKTLDAFLIGPIAAGTITVLSEA